MPATAPGLHDALLYLYEKYWHDTGILESDLPQYGLIPNEDVLELDELAGQIEDLLAGEPVSAREQLLLCLHCGAETSAAENERLDACPSCGDSEHVPANLDDLVTITLSRHELRILTFWASNWAGQHADSQRAIRTILDRLAIQTDTALTLSQELADLRAAFPGSGITVLPEIPGQ